jgi:hypothetical protein
MKKNVNVILSSLFLFYFIILIYSSSNNIVFNKFFGALLELITIPIIISTLIMYSLSIKNWYDEKFVTKSTNLISIIILTITIALLIISTIFNI